MSDDYTGHMLEQILDELRAVHELVGGVQETVAALPTRDEFNELKQDVKVVRAATTDTSRQVHDLEHRVLRLEAA
jgi:hypothetical protein